MTKLTGQCLCGDVKFEADGDIAIMANCHCTDCRQSTGSAFATLVFMKETDVKIDGKLGHFAHKVDSGNTLSKQFCTHCGSPMFGGNEGRPGMVAIRGGIINEQDVVKPMANVYASRKMDCTILDDKIPAFDKMPPKA